MTVIKLAELEYIDGFTHVYSADDLVASSMITVGIVSESKLKEERASVVAFLRDVHNDLLCLRYSVARTKIEDELKRLKEAKLE